MHADAIMHLVICILYFSDENKCSFTASMPRKYRSASNIGEGAISRQDPTKSFATEDMPFDLIALDVLLCTQVVLMPFSLL